MTEGLEELRYNTAIAALMELVNALRADNCCDQRRWCEELVVMLAPFAPHFAEECWERLGHTTSVFDARWPAWDEGLMVEDRVEVVVQVNGKTRSKVSVPRDADRGDGGGGGACGMRRCGGLWRGRRCGSGSTCRTGC